MKKIFGVMPVCLVAITLCGCGNGQPEKIQLADTAMGTVIQQNIYTTEKESRVPEEVMSLLHQLEEQELSKRLATSEVWRVNEAAGRDGGSVISAELSEILKECLDVWKKSGGAFDVALGATVNLWDIDGWASGERDEAFTVPDNGCLRDALEHSGSGKIELDGTSLYLRKGMSLDMGAVGKGIALDKILAYLQDKEEITGATISVGGSILTYGERPDGGRWRVGIVNPENTSDYIGILELEGQWCVSTSGDYERYVESDGIRYHHILDPATGYPADSGVAGVTVLTRSGFLSDALSTACFILGIDEGMKLAESYRAEVLFVGKDGSITMSEGMRAVFSEAG